jgi:anti-sigma factor RsiW
MTDKGAGARDRRLWQRWQALGEQSRVAEPDAMLLAAYAEGRLSEAEAEPVEAWLAVTPEALSDVIAARSAYQHPPRQAHERILDKASDLVPGMAPATAEILPFQPKAQPRLPRWRTALAWSSIAASLLCASLAGFSMGSDAYMNLSGMNLSGASRVDSAAADGFGTPSLDSYFSDDSGT